MHDQNEIYLRFEGKSLKGGHSNTFANYCSSNRLKDMLPEHRFAYILTQLHKGVTLPALKCSLDQYTSDHTQVLKGFRLSNR